MADFLLDSTTRHSIWLQRLASHEANTFDPVLRKVDRIIRDVLSATNEIGTKKQLNQITKRIRDEVGAEYRAWVEALISDLQEIAENEAAFTVKQLTKAVAEVDVVAPPFNAVWRAAITNPVQISDRGESSLLEPFIKSFTPREVDRVNGVIRNGFFQGRTTNQMIQQIRGTKTNRFKDGVLITSQRNAEAIARTSTNHVANAARAATFDGNADILTGWVFVATLDNRTTNICRFNDGKQYDIGAGPVPPLHVNCRSSQVPAVKEEYSILGIKEQTTRASRGASGGKQTTKSPFYEWLETQPRWFQEQVLGKTKTDLFRKGGLSAEEFRKLTSNRFGEPLTLAEIKAKDPDAWRDAGLN